ncbi:Exonuclease SbcC [Streptomyces misionensis JCM 4497]
MPPDRRRQATLGSAAVASFIPSRARPPAPRRAFRPRPTPAAGDLRPLRGPDAPELDEDESAAE